VSWKTAHLSALPTYFALMLDLSRTRWNPYVDKDQLFYKLVVLCESAAASLKCIIDVTYLFHTEGTDRKLLKIQQESKILAAFLNGTLGVEMKKA
jgi:hypothetical protein